MPPCPAAYATAARRPQPADCRRAAGQLDRSGRGSSGTRPNLLTWHPRTWPSRATGSTRSRPAPGAPGSTHPDDVRAARLRLPATQGQRELRDDHGGRPRLTVGAGIRLARVAAPGTDDHPDAVSALREIGFWLERSRAETPRVRAYRRAADVIEGLGTTQRDDHRARKSWAELSGIGPKTAKVIIEAEAGEVPDTLAKLRAEARPLATGGEELRQALRGDLHVHSDWSDGGSPLPEMMITARDLGHQYCAITDHSPRLKVARGLSAARLREQLGVVRDLGRELSPFVILQGIEVDILSDGSLDQEQGLLDELDVVVASVHSELRADSESMTHRMVAAIANPQVNVLGHCTGRLITGDRGTRPESVFDPEVVFEACRQFDTAVEINSRPERRDPPSRLMQLAYEMGCVFAIDTDAHAPGQLDFLAYGCERAAKVGIQPERIINTWPADRLLEWCRH
ncbi:MAG: PHP domain-containing protein [Microlunatus sp.]|nr:PHP domain-containing protein [Microlunatus sp.]